jgi:hypothetical protein
MTDARSLPTGARVAVVAPGVVLLLALVVAAAGLVTVADADRGAAVLTALVDGRRAG